MAMVIDGHANNCNYNINVRHMQMFLELKEQ